MGTGYHRYSFDTVFRLESSNKKENVPDCIDSDFGCFGSGGILELREPVLWEFFMIQIICRLLKDELLDNGYGLLKKVIVK